MKKLTTILTAGVLTLSLSAKDAPKRQERRQNLREKRQEKIADAKEKRDGKKTVVKNGAKSWTAERDATVTKTEDGKVIVVEGTKTLKNGQTIETTRETTVTKTDDGRTWETEASRTGAKGTSTMNATGTATKTENGADFNIEREGTRANGVTWNSTTEGTATKKSNGREWTSTTTGNSSTGKTWVTDKNGKVVRTGEGTAKRMVHGKTTVNGEKSFNWHRKADITKTETGRHIEVKGNRSAVQKKKTEAKAKCAAKKKATCRRKK